MVSASSAQLPFRWARRVFIVLQIIASVLAFVLAIPWKVILFAFFFIPGPDYSPSDTFHTLRRFFFRTFAGRLLRPITLRTSLPPGTSVHASGNTII
jgi:hypothetical protein